MDWDFVANATVKDQKDIPERVSSFYAKDEAAGVFKLKDTDPAVKSAVEVITGMNQALRAARQDARTARERTVDLAPLSDFGKTPEEIASSIKTKINELTEQIAAGKGAKLDLEKIKTEFISAHGKELAKKDGQITRLKKQLEAIIVDEAARRAVGTDAHNPELVLPFIRDRVKAIEEDDRVVAVVVDTDGTRRLNPSTGAAMTINELVAELKAKETYAPLFKSTAKAGGGATPGASAGRTNGADSSNLSATDKIRRGLTAGLAKRRSQEV